MQTRLYVGNLSFETTKTQILDMLESTGVEVLDVFVPKADVREDGREHCNPGYAFVGVGSREEGRRVILCLNGTKDPGGRTLIVRRANERRTSYGEAKGKEAVH